MKYPQLVSPRAVNAISDWLVSRLEQLGVESPQIYSRLLLSLLQSSVQVNDPIEFSNLETFFANRKGGNKRFHLPSDTETLKKLNAVQCLREIVSNEQDISTIEKLVDELCEKFKEIDKQTQNLRDGELYGIQNHLNTDSLQHSNKQYENHQQHHDYKQQQQQQQIANNCNSLNSGVLNIDSKQHYVLGTSTTSSNNLNDLDNDPRNRYFRAFPALSKEMEDYFPIWRRNAKSLTWPVVGRSIVVDNLSNSTASLSSSSVSSNSASTNKSAERKLKVVVGRQLEKKLSKDISNSACSGNIGRSDVQKHQGAVATVAVASVKKKSKRRRNQALGKGKTIQNIRKLPVGTTSNSVGVNKYHSYTHNRNSSPAWDTDFKGCWEMGPDLIKEFLSRQKGNKRIRSKSGSMDHDPKLNENEIPAKNVEQPIMKRYIDLSFCCDENDDEINNYYNETQRNCTQKGLDYLDEDYDDNTLSTVSELTMDNFNLKRLYQREGHTLKSLAFGDTLLGGNTSVDYTLNESVNSVDSLDFQQFKAKFNSSVEALWKDVEPTPNINAQQPIVATQSADNTLRGNNSLGSGVSSAFYATTSLNALAPFKKDLWNFWSNYQQEHYDQINNNLSTATSISSMIMTPRLNDISASCGTGADIAKSDGYISMPSNLDDFNKSVGSVRRPIEVGGSPFINVFLKNSIWSTYGDCVDSTGTTSEATAADTDQSFLFKVWHSNKKLSELDVGNAINGEKVFSMKAGNDDVNKTDCNESKEPCSLMINNQNLDASLQFPPYQNLKWSEGINAGPPYGSLRTHENVGEYNEKQSLKNFSSLRDNNNYSDFSSVTGISGATWKASTYEQNAQPDLKSWCASNPVSLTEMYGKDVCDSIVNQQTVEENESNQSEVVNIGPAVTLSNHCASTSGFVAYSRIKQCGIVQPHVKPVQSSNAMLLSMDFFRNSEDENLLTSECTHFRPIDNFVDGHTFDISNALDTIKFERTSSGVMRYESEEYLEYTRNDIYIADEEVTTNSTNFLKYSQNENKNKNDMFVIKFRVKRSGDVACQTEEKFLQLESANISELPTNSTTLGHFPPSLDVSNMFHNTFSLSRQANSEAIMAAVTQAVAAAAKAAAKNHLNAGHFSWLPITKRNISTCANDSGTAIGIGTDTGTRENHPLYGPDSTICDEVDFCKIDNITVGQRQYWPILELEKQCNRSGLSQQQQQQERKGKVHTSSIMERNEEISLNNTPLHTLWGMCAVCNSCEYGKSMPANRLLRDELQLEADEIMSDLRFMQDLYIGESNILNEPRELQSRGENEQEFVADKKTISIKNPWNMNINDRDDQQNDAERVLIFQKVNQLIEDLLQTENTENLPEETFSYDQTITKHTQLSKSWNLETDNGKTKNFSQIGQQKDNNIWEHRPLIKEIEGKTSKNKEFVKPMKLLKQVGSSLNESTRYKEALNWEHDNLAKIWQQSMPSSTKLEEMLVKDKQNEAALNIINLNLLKEKEESTEGRQNVIEEKIIRNLQNSNDLTRPSTSSCSTYKSLQQFFNNSTAKMKLAANRKRRHSASQNFYHHQQLNYNSTCSSHLNNNNNITDFNVHKPKFNCTIKSDSEQQQQLQHQHEQEIKPDNNTTHADNVHSEKEPPKQTIITCKYWTAATNGTQSSMDSAAAAMMLLAAATNTNNNMLTADNFDQEDVMLDGNIFSNTFSRLIDKNATILNHVSIMSRPLTR